MKRPNIIYFHSHDTGRYIQPYGHKIPTPNMQRLAEEGVLFRQAFCAAPTCSPSRAALLTGQSAHSSGMLGLQHRGFDLYDPSQHIATTLRDAGYETMLCGMQHVYGQKPVVDLGFTRTREANRAYAPHDVAVDFFKERKGNGDDKPFFLDIGYGLTHRSGSRPGILPHHCHKDSPIGDPRYVRPPAPLPDTPETRQDMADFIEAAKRLDANLGIVLDALDDYGLADNTIVMQTTDHGIAFPAMKCNLTDHGMGILLIMRGPHGFDGGKVVDAMVSHVDVFPSLCEVAGIDKPSWLEGMSFMPLVRGEADRVRDEVFAEVTYHASYEPKRAVRTARYKYIRHYDDRGTVNLPNCDDSPSKSLWTQHGWAKRPIDKERLYDLTFDPSEVNNLIDDPRAADIAQDMRARLDRWMRDTNDPLLEGDVPLPKGGTVNDPDCYSPQEPLIEAK